MKTTVIYWENNAYNAVVITQGNGFAIICDGDRHGMIDGVDLYSDTAADDLRALYKDLIETENLDLSGMCNKRNIFSGDFEPEENDKVEIIAEFDYEDLTPYISDYID